MFNFIIDKSKSGKYHMKKDLTLFRKIEKGENTSFFRLFSWKTPTISLGYSQVIDKELNVDNCQRNGVEIVKRPTGGGMVFHNIHEISYSIIAPKHIFPKGLYNSYIFISEIIVKVLLNLGIPAKIADEPKKIDRNWAKLCFLYPNEHEIVVNGKKIIGSAQKRGKNALLQQGSIFVAENNAVFENCIKDKGLLLYLKKSSISMDQIFGRIISFNDISDEFKKQFTKYWGENCLVKRSVT